MTFIPGWFLKMCDFCGTSTNTLCKIIYTTNTDNVEKNKMTILKINSDLTV